MTLRSLACAVSNRGGNDEIYVMREDGSGLRNVSNSPARDIHPYWSPDRSSILFNSDRDGGTLQLYEVRPDGTGLHRLAVSEDEETCARVSPRGDSIVLLANLKEGRDDVILRRRDGSNPVNVTHDAPPDGWPTWTPDGRRIAFNRQKGETICIFVADLPPASPSVSAPPVGR
jgi:TolB protein